MSGTDDARPPKPPDRAPVERLRRLLEDDRAAGVDFDAAWARALAVLQLDASWRRALTWSREAWSDAYDARPPAGRHGAAWALGDDERTMAA